MGGFVAPVPVDAVNLSIQPASTYGFNTMIDGPYPYGGNLYTVLATYASPSVINVFKSTDGGLTWSTALNPGGAPSQLSFESSFDGIHTLNIVITGDGTDTQIVSFNLVTETWGAPGATLNGLFPFVILSRSDGSCVVAGQDSAGIHVDYAIFSGGIWGAQAHLDTNAYAVMVAPVSFNSAFGVVDSTNRCHFVFDFTDNNGVNDVEDVFYQAVSPAGALASFFQFPNVGTVIANFTSGFRSVPGIASTSVVFPIATINGANNELSVYIGTPLAAPVWTLHQTIDPGFTTPGSAGYDQASARISGGVLRIIYSPGTGGTFSFLRVCQTTDFATFVFSNSTVFDYTSSLVPAGFVFAGQSVFNPLSLAAGTEFTATAPDQSTLQRFFMPFISAGGGVTLTGAPPNGTVGTPSSFCFTASGGTPPYTFAITAGSLPPGLSLGASTGCITGTPSTTGVFCFTVMVTDSLAATASVSPCMTIIGAAPFSRVLSGTRRKDCPPSVKTNLDWSAFSQAVEDLRPPDVEEVRVPPCGGILRTN
jgi:hypothetical protein